MSLPLFDSAFAEGWKPEPDLTVSQWAAEHRYLDSKASAEPGLWRNERTPYLVEIMDALSPSHPAKRVVFMSGAQVGKTECGNNWIGFTIHNAPAPTLMVQPTVEMAKRVSKQRLAPMIEASPVLQERVSEARSRDSGNTTFVKEFPGGLLILTGSNSGAGLRSMPIKNLFADEVDEYPGDVDGQGDPVSLAEKRTTTFPRRKIFVTSTPTIKGLSKIEAEFLRSDQRRYYVPCSHCGNMDWMRWENIRWEKGHTETAALMCLQCTELIPERMKTDMLAAGEWRATAEGDGTVGFHLNGLYSPIGWTSWAEIAAEFIAAKDDVFLYKTWVNTRKGESWEERGEMIDADSLQTRLEDYGEIGEERIEVPHGVGVLVASVDVQGDRLEAKVKGYGIREESWLVAYTQIPGDPVKDETWFELDKFRRQKFLHASGQRVPVTITTVDSGGNHTEQVYKYCKSRLSERVFAIKGGSERGKPVVPQRATNRNRYRARLYVLCVDSAKEIIMSRLKIKEEGPGFMHLPTWVHPDHDPEYLEQLVSEKAVWRWVKNKGTVRDWIKTRDRNEALDLEVYCLAALYILGRAYIKSLPELALALSAPPGDEKDEAPAPVTQRRKGWVSGWK